MKKSKNTTNRWIAIGTIGLLAPTVILLFIAKEDAIGHMFEGIAASIPAALVWMIAVANFALLAYCVVRMAVAIGWNIFLPKIPMPQTLWVKCVMLAILGTIIGLVSPMWLLAAWIVTCIVGLYTYTFI